MKTKQKTFPSNDQFNKWLKDNKEHIEFISPIWVGSNGTIHVHYAKKALN